MPNYNPNSLDRLIHGGNGRYLQNLHNTFRYGGPGGAPIYGTGYSGGSKAAYAASAAGQIEAYQATFGYWIRTYIGNANVDDEVTTAGNNSGGYSMSEVTIKPVYVYEFISGVEQLFNVGAVSWGMSELSLYRFQNDAAARIAQFSGAGQARIATALGRTAKVVGSLSKGAGIFGYGVSAISIGSKLATGENISTGEAVGFGVNTVFLAAGAIAVGTVAAPFVATAALIYGAAQLVSYATTGQTLEENIFD